MQQTNSLEKLTIKIFADLGTLEQIQYWHQTPLIRGITTNPSLLSKSKIQNYEKFARSITDLFPYTPISFSVLADDFSGMLKQAKIIHSWGPQVYVKIPVVNSQGKSTLPIIKALSQEGIAVNATAIMKIVQITEIIPEISPQAKMIFSVFSGRIADTGQDPKPIISVLAKVLSSYEHMQLLWASPREILNIFQANEAGCDIITLTPALLDKLHLIDKNLEQYSIETVQEFYQEGKKVMFNEQTNNLC